MTADYVAVEDVSDGDDGRVYIRGVPLTGQTREFHYNGELSAIISYTDGIEDGPRQLFWPNGKIQSEGTKEMDRRVGIWREWYENGQMKSEAVYKIGARTPIRSRTWAEDGSEALRDR